MLRLLKIDFKKFAFTKTFWVLFLAYFVLIVLVYFLAENVLNMFLANAQTSAPIPVPEFSLYSFPYIWQNLSYLGGWFKILIALIVLIFVSNEFNYRTHRQNIMNGMTRMEFLASKVIFAALISLSATFLLLISGIILGVSHTIDLTFTGIFTKMEFLLAYFLEIFTLASLALLFSFLFRQTGLAIVLFALYYILVERIISAILPDAVSKFLPLESMGNLIDIPNSALMQMFGVSFSDTVSIPDVFFCMGWNVVFIGLTYLYMQKRDL